MQLTDLVNFVGDHRGERRHFDYVIVSNGVAYATTGGIIAWVPFEGLPNGYYDPIMWTPIDDPTLQDSTLSASQIEQVIALHSGGENTVFKSTPTIRVMQADLAACGDDAFDVTHLTDGATYKYKRGVLYSDGLIVAAWDWACI